MLAVVAAVLAIVMQQPVLYAAVAVLVLVVIILWLGTLRRRHRESQRLYTKPATPAADDLQALGIVDIRPKERGAPPETVAPLPPEAAPAEEDPAAPPAAPPQKVYAGGSGPPGRPAPPARPAPTREVLMPGLQALRIALGARVACLLRQEGATDYRILALSGQGRPRGSFSSRIPLLPPEAADEPLTIRRVGAEGIPPGDLGYGSAPEGLHAVALAPLAHPVARYLLVVDSNRAGLLDAPWAQARLAAFARLFETLMAPEDAAPPETASGEAASHTSERPRREIIAEAMARARAEDRRLALGLVYLNRAEHVAEQGPAPLAEAEQLMESRLREAAHPARVERFGELTYGVFYDGADLEDWSQHVQQAFAHANGPLDGGVSMGVALLGARHDSPDALRADAADALAEALRSGTCVILE